MLHGVTFLANEKMDAELGVLYGYMPPLMQDVVNLILTYDIIYDYDGELEVFKAPATILSDHFSGGKLQFDDLCECGFDNAFIFSVQSRNITASIFGIHSHRMMNLLTMPNGWTDHVGPLLVRQSATGSQS